MEAVERDYNHPSIIIWVPINESWGVPDLADPRQQNHLKSLYALTHSLDATRLVIDNEGWEHTDMTDLFALHDYTRTGELLYERYKDLGKPGAPRAEQRRRRARARLQLQRLALSTFRIRRHRVHSCRARSAEGILGILGRGEDGRGGASNGCAGIYQAIARVPAWAGLCYTQLTDVEQEINGLHDLRPQAEVRREADQGDERSGRVTIAIPLAVLTCGACRE